MDRDRTNRQGFRKKIWDYYRIRKRDLPWRHTKDPYKILVSEVMLQQTQVARVSEKYREFLGAYPTIRDLAKAPLANVLRVWQGLGYNRRAVALKRLAEEVVVKHQGKIPLDFESLTALPGVGRSTAGAVTVFAADVPVVLIETNIRRVFIHFFFSPKQYSNILKNVGMSSSISDAEILPLVEKTLPKKNVREWYWALMDYGAMLGADKLPNPNRRSMHYTRQSTFQGSNRQLRGQILKFLLDEKVLSARQLQQKTAVAAARLQHALNQLVREGFLVKTGGRYALAQ